MLSSTSRATTSPLSAANRATIMVSLARPPMETISAPEANSRRRLIEPPPSRRRRRCRSHAPTLPRSHAPTLPRSPPPLQPSRPSPTRRRMRCFVRGSSSLEVTRCSSTCCSRSRRANSATKLPSVRAPPSDGSPRKVCARARWSYAHALVRVPESHDDRRAFTLGSRSVCARFALVSRLPYITHALIHQSQSTRLRCGRGIIFTGSGLTARGCTMRMALSIQEEGPRRSCR